ncbi:MAG: transcriptional regulator [Hyphomicrobiales bacterium]|nr:MAG: transcriptional regulator [Hyphomicrobiales bacterium]
MGMEFGSKLKEWRNHRRLSQMGLAGEAGISTRHLSFLETGRSRPTEGMIIRLCEALEVNATESNMLFSAAGFTPRYQGTTNADQLPEEVAQAINLIMENHDPYPAVLLNSSYDILKANQGYLRFAALMGVDEPTDINMLDLLIASDMGKSLIVNWKEVARSLILRARSEAWLQGPSSPLHAHIKRLMEDEAVAEALSQDLENLQNPVPAAVLPITISLGALETSWITTITSFGSARDALVDGLMIEQSFPANEQTRMLVSQMN